MHEALPPTFRSRCLGFPLNSTMKTVLALTLVTASFLCMRGVASAGPILLDQSSPPPIQGASFGGGIGCACAADPDSFDIAQSFIVGMTGILSRVEVYVNSTFVGGELLFDIRPTTGGVPQYSNAAALLTRTIPSSAVPQNDTAFFSIDLTESALAVAAGESLAFVLRSSGNWGFGGRTDNPYADGQFFSRRLQSSPVWTAVPSWDLTFVTYVETPTPNPVPEPSTLALLGLGAVSASLRGRLRKRSLK